MRITISNVHAQKLVPAASGKPSICASIGVPVNSLQLTRSGLYITSYVRKCCDCEKKSVSNFLQDLHVFSPMNTKKLVLECCPSVYVYVS
jgi:hypothetical protein